MEVLLVVCIVLPLAAWLIAAPLLGGRADVGTTAEEAERADLEAARDAKYAEIRDAELDYRTGKLSESDWRELDRRLRKRGGPGAPQARPAAGPRRGGRVVP